MHVKFIAILLASVSFYTPHSAYAQNRIAAPSADGKTDEGLQDIVVTAQRREERLQSVPIAVTALGSESLAQIRLTNIVNLNGFVPGLQITTQGLASTPSLTIRGIQSATSDNSVDPKIGVYVDGVYIGRLTGSIFDLGDIQRVEVLRGPQGTLFGRNATGGAISLITSAPTGKLGVKATVSYANYDAKRFKASVDLPAVGPLSLKLSYLHDDTDGYGHNLLAGQTIDLSRGDQSFGVQRFARSLGSRNVDGGQVAARLDLEDLVIDYRFDYTDSRTAGNPIQSFGVIPNSTGPLLSPIISFQPLFGGVTNTSQKRLTTVANATSIEHIVSQGHNLTLTWHQSDSVEFKSIIGYRKFRQDPNIYDLSASGGVRFTTAQLFALLGGNVGGIFDPNNAPGSNDRFFALLTARSTQQRQFSEEAQMVITGDGFDATAGIFYFQERSPATNILGVFEPTDGGVLTPNPIIDAIFGGGTNRTVSENHSMAGYVQATYHLNEHLDITGGARYTLDDRKINIISNAGASGGGLGTGIFKTSFQKASFTGIATYRPRSDIMTYAKVATGYVAGGVLSGIVYEPENLTAYELGFKSQVFNNKLRVNMALFYNDYKDIQQQQFANGIQIFVNAGSAKIKGFELEVEAKPARGLTLSGNLSYTDSKFKDFVLGGFDVSNMFKTNQISKWTMLASAQYDAPEILGGGNPFGRVDVKYRSRHSILNYDNQVADLFTGISDQALVNSAAKPGFWTVDGRVGLHGARLGSGELTISAFGRNLLNKHDLIFGAPVFSLVGTFDRGRTYGLEATVSY